MPTDPRKRQKKQERRAAKRKAKHHQLAREKQAGLAERLTAAAKYPVLDSCATTALWDEGLGWVCLSRELPSGHVAFAVFLVDRYCLGVKNVMADVVGRFEYNSQIVSKMRSHFSAKDLSPADVRKLVEEAVEYARGLGLHPHPDYQKAKRIFGDIDAGASTEQIEFGKGGKPLFIAGPNDTPERCRQILKTLEETCGPGGFHYQIPFPDAEGIFPEPQRGVPPPFIGTMPDWDMDGSQDEEDEEDDEHA
ncbi:MAG TPA: hypothetical protein VG013_19445 [Gemmataceae bacterium]|nr:hypothetical protein [Gemmataceae bacterium]